MSNEIPRPDCECERREGESHKPGCEALAFDYAEAIYKQTGSHQARNSGVSGAFGEIDDSALFQSCVPAIQRMLDAQHRLDFERSAF